MNTSILHSNMLWLSIPIIVLAIFFFLYVRYRRDMQNAYAHLNSIDHDVIETKYCPVDFAIHGEGEPVLVSHGIAGGFDQALGLAEAYLGNGYKVIAPSRFGYHGTPMPTDATPASQADAFVGLLDSLNIERVAVMANSAGGTSAIQMALRHPERIKALIFISTAAPTVGVPDGYSLSESDQTMVSGVIRSVLPIKRRTAGFVFDMFTSNTDMDQHPDEYPLEKIIVPALVVHAMDDPLAAYDNAEALAARIPNAKLLSIPRGGHLLLGMEQMVRSETAQFLQSVTNSNELLADVSFRGE